MRIFTLVFVRNLSHLNPSYAEVFTNTISIPRRYSYVQKTLLNRTHFRHENHREIESIFVNALACQSGTQMGQFSEKIIVGKNLVTLYEREL